MESQVLLSLSNVSTFQVIPTNFAACLCKTFCTTEAQQISFLVCNCFCFNQVYVRVEINSERASNKCPNPAITTLIADSCTLAEPIISTILGSNRNSCRALRRSEPVHEEPIAG